MFKENKSSDFRMTWPAIDLAVCLSLYFSIFLVYWISFNYFLNNGILTDWLSHRRFATNPAHKIPPNAMLHRLIQLVDNKPVGISFFAALAKTSLVIAISELYFRKKQKIGIINVCVALMIAVSMPVMFLAGHKAPYLGKFAINVLHNPTYIIMAPFAVLFWWMFTRKVIIERQRSIRLLLSLAVVSLLLAYAKPSFHLGFLPAAALISIPYAFKSKREFTWFFALGFALSLPILIQMLELLFPQFGGFSPSKIVIAPFVALKMIVTDPKGAILSSYLFPMFVIAFLTFGLNRNSSAFEDLRIGQRIFLMSLLMLMTSFLVAILFGEEGRRMGNGNFIWNIYSAGLIVFVEAATLVLIHMRSIGRRTLAWIAIFILGIHTYYGFDYAKDIFLGLRGL